MVDFNADKAREIADNFHNEDFMVILKNIEKIAMKGKYEMYIRKDTHGVILYLLHLRGFKIIEQQSENTIIISWENK